MSVGFPDWGTWLGRGAGGEDITTYSISVPIPGEATATVSLPDVPEGFEYVFNALNISVNDDEAIHNIYLHQVDADHTFFLADFVQNGIFDFPGKRVTAGDNIEISITNNHEDAKTFKGMIYWTKRKI